MDYYTTLEIKIGSHSIFIKQGELLPIRPDFKDGQQGISDGSYYAGKEIPMEDAKGTHFNSRDWAWNVKDSLDFPKLRKKYNLP